MPTRNERERPDNTLTNSQTEHSGLPPENGLATLLEDHGLFSPQTPKGKSPICFPADVIDNMLSDISMRVFTEGQATPRAATWPVWQQSLKKIQSAYDFIVYPILDQAEEHFNNDPARNKLEHGPASYKSAINEAISDAIEHPGIDTREFPHRAPIVLNNEEAGLLGRVVAARGLPFNPEKRVYSYAALAPLKAARSKAVERSLIYQTIRENTLRSGMVRSRDEIEKEIRQRQESWRSSATPRPPAQSTRRKPRK